MTIEAMSVGFLGTNCYLVYSGEKAVVIDPGADAERIHGRVEKLSLKVEYVLLTHAHFDHVLAVSEIIEKTGAKLVSTAGERLRLADEEVSGHTMLRTREFIPLSADMEVSDGEVLSVGDMTFEFIATPGHTEGSVCIKSGDVLFSGDTLFADTCGRCDLAGGDINEMMKSLKKLYELPGDFRVLPGHGEETALSRERESNMYMIEAARR